MTPAEREALRGPLAALARCAGDAIMAVYARDFTVEHKEDRSPLTEGREFSVLSPRTWRLADLGAKHALLLEGIGWGNMPRHAVAGDLAAGRLVALCLPEAARFDYRLHALWRKDSRPGPASVWLLDALVERC